MKIEFFGGKQPMFEPEKYFLGKTRGAGMFHDRFGNLRTQFTIDMMGEIEGDILVLSEDFLFDDGSTDRRTWRLASLGHGRYEGVASDVIGMAKGRVVGNAFQWCYKLNLKVGGGHWRVAFDDWLFLQPGGVILNRATVTRWGFEIGTMTATFSKKSVDSISDQFMSASAFA
jgi:hypothetical protein